jgi:SAM-dependent methyltransferase
MIDSTAEGLAGSRTSVMGFIGEQTIVQTGSQRRRQMRTDQLAAQTWDKIESLEETNRRIHDGAAGDEALTARANGYVKDLLFGNFPQAIPPAAAEILEIGSGVGWIMQAMNEYLSELGVPPRRIVGIDIAPAMSAKAQQRLGDHPPYEYQVYDGITIPVANRSFDLIYSVACLQHVPRPYVFNLFFEIRRLLKSRGFAVLHFMSTDALPRQELHMPWRTEIDMQIQGREGHWHHFYTRNELADVLAVTGFPYVALADDRCGCLVACLADSPLTLPEDFDPEAYLEFNADVRRAHADPARHYLDHGHAEGRKWFRDRRPVSRQVADYHFRERCADLLVEREKVREELFRFHEDIAALRRQLDAVRSLLSWRLLAPLRRAADTVRRWR